MLLHPVVVVGAGPVGLTMALLLAKRGTKVLVLDEKNGSCVGSRAICFSKRTLEIFDKIGMGDQVVAQGVQWNIGRIFFQNQEIDRFDLRSDKNSKYPPFVNLPQDLVESILIETASKHENIDIKWGCKLQGFKTLPAIRQGGHLPHAHSLYCFHNDNNLTINCQFLIACDGSRSVVRNAMKLKMVGEEFEENFLIIDFKMDADFPPERWFWFSPPHSPKETILLHKQPGNIWRLDVKLGKHINPEITQETGFITQKIKETIGNKPVSIKWVSLYRFSCKMLESFVYDQVIFAGDAAHFFSPFGARGANSGIQDADNLAWKISYIIKNQASLNLLKTYDYERALAARQNIEVTVNSSLFISPPSEKAEQVRNAILLQAASDSGLKRKINCGRLSVPNVYGKHNFSEEGEWPNSDLEPGHCVKDCYFESHKSYLIEKLPYGFTLLTLENTPITFDPDALKEKQLSVLTLQPETDHQLIQLYDFTPGSAYLLTPDQYILGRWKNATTNKIIRLLNAYLSGLLYPAILPLKTEQEQIDNEVAHQLVSFNSKGFSEQTG